MLTVIFWTIYYGFLASMLSSFIKTCICQDRGHKRVHGVCMRCLNIGKESMIIPEVFATETVTYGPGTLGSGFRQYQTVQRIREANEQMMYTTFEANRIFPTAMGDATVATTNTPIENTTIGGY